MIARPPDVHPVDLAGAGTTIENDPFTTGSASMAKAVVGGFTPDGRSPAGQSLADAYAAWKARQADPPEVQKRLTVDADDRAKAKRKAAKRAAKKLRQAREALAVASPGAVEERAMGKGHKAVAERLAEGGTQLDATARGYARYKRHGGTASLAAWRRKAGL